MENNEYNILYVISTLRRCGPTNQLYGIIKYLNEDNFKPTILTISPENNENTLIEKFKKLNIEIKSLDLDKISYFLKGKNSFEQFITDNNFNIIHTTGVRPDKLVSSTEVKNHISTIRNYAYDDYPVKFGKIIGNVLAYNHIKILKNINYRVSCSNTIKKILQDNHNMKSHVIHNGIDSDQFDLINNEKKKRLRKKLNLPIDKKIFITVGSLIKRKDPITILKAFNNINKDNKHLIVLGDGPLLKKCKEIKSDNISLLGFVTNVKKYYNASDVFISASYSEGLPNTVLEAIGTGLPVILSDIGPHKEILKINDEIGSLFKLGNINELKELIIKYSKINTNSIKSKAREVLVNNFSAKIMSEKYQDYYIKILSEGR